jgi:hypothetical protein
MFRYDKKRVNREVDELKRLLAITKGAKASNKSISASFLKEELDLTGNQTQPPAPDMGADMGADMDKPMGDIGTDDSKEIEKAIQNSTVTTVGPEGDTQVVKGYVATSDDEKGLYFKFSSKEPNPVIQTKKAITLDDDLLKSIEQIATYFDTWKTNVEK